MEIIGEEIRVDLERSAQNKESPRREKVSSLRQQTFVVLGGGAAGTAAVQELRALGFAGRLVMVSQEQRPPYDRPLLSKMYLSGDADSKQLPLRPETLLNDCQVEFVVAEIECLDPESRIISFKDSAPSLHYDEVLVATGGKPKLLPLVASGAQPFLLRGPSTAIRWYIKIGAPARR